NNVFYGPRGREEYPNDTPFGTAPVDPVVDPDIVLAVAQLDQMSSSVPVDRPWESSSAEQWDRQTLDTWLRANTSGSDEFMAVSSAATEAIFGCEPRELSLLYTLFYIAASGNEQNAGTFERNFDTGGGAQESRFVGGAQTIALRVAAQLGQRVVLSAPVRRITQSTSGVTVVSDRFSVTGRRVIVAIPPTLAGRIDYQPPLPPLRDQLVQHMPQGSLMKFEAIYTTPFWPAQGLAGHADRVRDGAPDTRRAHPLGWHRDLDLLERIHGRRGALGRAGGAGGAGGARLVSARAVRPPCAAMTLGLLPAPGSSVRGA